MHGVTIDRYYKYGSGDAQDLDLFSLLEDTETGTWGDSNTVHSDFQQRGKTVCFEWTGKPIREAWFDKMLAEKIAYKGGSKLEEGPCKHTTELNHWKDYEYTISVWST